MTKNRRFLLAIFILAGLAGIFRAWLNKIFVSDWTNLWLNALAVFCMVISLEGYLQVKKVNPTIIKALQIGFFGGLTTIASPFLLIYQAFALGYYARAILIWSLHAISGLLALYLGRVLVSRWSR